MPKLVLLTHGGLCHADEILACSLVLAKESENFEEIIISRTGEKVPNQYRSPEYKVWVIDCGMIYDPARKLFDHHGVNEEDCSFSQIAKYYNLHEKFKKYASWYERVIVSDNRGLSQWLKNQHEFLKTSTVIAFNNPFEGFIKMLFGSLSCISKINNPEIYFMLFNLGKHILTNIETKEFEENYIKSHLKIIGKIGYIWSDRMLISIGYEAKKRSLAYIVMNSMSGRDDSAGTVSILSTNSSIYNLHSMNLKELGAVNFIHKQGYLAVIRPFNGEEISEDMLRRMSSILNKQMK